MGPPAAIDLQIALRDALVFEARLFEQAAGGLVFRQAGGLDARQVEAGEGLMHRRFDRLAHVALAGKGFARPIAQGAGLGRPAADVVEGDRTDEVLIAAPDQKERHGVARGDRALRPVDTVCKSLAGQVILGPCRLPRAQVVVAGAAQGRPGAEIGVDRRAQGQPFRFNPQFASPQHQAARRL